MTREQKDRLRTALFALAGLYGCWLVALAAKHPGEAFIMLLFTGTVGYKVHKLLLPRRLRARAIAKAEGAIEKHMDQLLRRRAQLVRSDPYGKLQTEKWTKEAQYFEKEHIRRLLTVSEVSALRDREISLSGLVQRKVESMAKQRPSFTAFSEEFTGVDFEIFCAEQLRLSGWDARVTMQSRDQGIDVIAEKAGIRVVLQCKLYSSPVGNKAVQEIAAGRSHERAHYAAVVTNHRYTSSAEELAATNDVLLLHYRDLPTLSDELHHRPSKQPSDSRP